jgi:hypothetical protein
VLDVDYRPSCHQAVNFKGTGPALFRQEAGAYRVPQSSRCRCRAISSSGCCRPSSIPPGPMISRRGNLKIAASRRRRRCKGATCRVFEEIETLEQLLRLELVVGRCRITRTRRQSLLIIDESTVRASPAEDISPLGGCPVARAPACPEPQQLLCRAFGDGSRIHYSPSTRPTCVLALFRKPDLSEPRSLPGSALAICYPGPHDPFPDVIGPPPMLIISHSTEAIGLEPFGILSAAVSASVPYTLFASNSQCRRETQADV